MENNLEVNLLPVLGLEAFFVFKIQHFEFFTPGDTKTLRRDKAVWFKNGLSL